MPTPFGGPIEESEEETDQAQDTVMTNRSSRSRYSQPSTEEGGTMQYHSSHPPESMFMLTPANDPESTFAQRPAPPRRLSDHTFMTEVIFSLIFFVSCLPFALKAHYIAYAWCIFSNFQTPTSIVTALPITEHKCLLASQTCHDLNHGKSDLSESIKKGVYQMKQWIASVTPGTKV